MRHVGVDLHKTNFVACFLAANDTQRLETYPLIPDGLARFLPTASARAGWGTGGTAASSIKSPRTRTTKSAASRSASACMSFI